MRLVFHPLTRENIQGIAKIQLETLSKRLRNEGYDLTLGESIYDRVATVGFDPVFWCKTFTCKAIQNEIADPLAKLLLSGKIPVNKALILEVDSGTLKAVRQNHISE